MVATVTLVAPAFVETLVAPFTSAANTAIAAFDAARIGEKASRKSFSASVMLAGVALACADQDLTGSQVATRLGALVIAGNAKSTLNSYRSALSWYLCEGSNLATLRVDCSRPGDMSADDFGACVNKIAERCGDIWGAYLNSKKADRAATKAKEASDAAEAEARKAPAPNPLFVAVTNAKAAIAVLIEAGAFELLADVLKSGKVTPKAQAAILAKLAA